MNTITISGDLPRDPELKYVGDRGSPKVAFTVHNVEGKRQSYIPVEAWDALAEQVAEQCRAGARIEVIGSIASDAWPDRETGKTRTKVYIRMTDFRLSGVGTQPRTAPPPRVNRTIEDLPF